MPEINFFWDPLSDNILQERDETGAVTAEYTAEPGLYGNIISQNRGGVESQFHYDAQGSTLAVTDDNQNVTDTFAYTAFGEVTERTGTTAVPFQYIGQKGYYRDNLTGQYLVRRRVHEPARARWQSCDPLPFPDSPNLYLYVHNSPQVSVDPTGEVTCPPIAFPIGIPLSGIFGPFAAAVLIHPEPPVGVPIFLPSTQPLPPTQEQLDRIWRNSRYRKTRKGQCTCGYARTDHKGNEDIGWEPAGKGKITYGECLAYCKQHYGDILRKIKWDGDYFDV